MTNGTTTCDRCGDTYGPLDEMRFRAGTWTETADGTTATYETLCEDCHRDLVRS